MSILACKNLRKSYKGLQVVKDISLQIKNGEVVGLLGPNGAGKTTFFYMMIGLVKPESGSIYLDSSAITHLAMFQRARLGIGYLPQENSVFRNLSVEENILAVLELQPKLPRDKKLEILENMLGEFSLMQRRHTLGIRLSGGERRRVEIARALALKPQFILLDEPFAGIDPIAVADIQATIRHLQARGIGILISDHNVRETLGICDRAYILSEGKVLASGLPQELIAHSEVKQAYLGEDFRI